MSAVKFVLDTDIDMHAAAGQDRPSSQSPELTYHLSCETLSRFFHSVISLASPSGDARTGMFVCFFFFLMEVEHSIKWRSKGNFQDFD